MGKFALMCAALAIFSVPALAATDYYVAQNATTKKCELTQIKPDGKTMMMVGKTFYTSKAAAETAMKADKLCK